MRMIKAQYGLKTFLIVRAQDLQSPIRLPCSWAEPGLTDRCLKSPLRPSLYFVQ